MVVSMRQGRFLFGYYSENGSIKIKESEACIVRAVLAAKPRHGVKTVKQIDPGRLTICAIKFLVVRIHRNKSEYELGRARSDLEPNESLKIIAQEIAPCF